MDLQTVQKITELERKVEATSPPEKPIDLISPFLALPGLVAFWPMSAIQKTTGLAYDLAQGRHLTYNGNPTYNYVGLVPYIDLDGTGDYLSRPDETSLDITGTETVFPAAIRGLTMGGWFWFDDTAADYRPFAKWSGASPAYLLRKPAGTALSFLCNDGGGTDTVNSTVTISAQQWIFSVGRFVPNTSQDIYINGNKDSLTVGVNASIRNSSTALVIGSDADLANPMDGRASLCFLCAAALSDAIISNLFQTTRAAFGV